MPRRRCVPAVLAVLQGDPGLSWRPRELAARVGFSEQRVLAALHSLAACDPPRAVWDPGPEGARRPVKLWRAGPRLPFPASAAWGGAGGASGW